MVKRLNISNFFALSMTKFFKFIADTFFAKRYGHRAVVLETIAGVPGMVAGMLIHLRSLRRCKQVMDLKLEKCLLKLKMKECI